MNILDRIVADRRAGLKQKGYDPEGAVPGERDCYTLRERPVSDM